MTSEAAALLERVIPEIFNERDADARLRAMTELCTDDIRFVDPEGSVVGVPAFADHVTAFLASIDPTFRFFSAAPVQAADDLAIHRWVLGPSADAPVVTGTDVIIVRDGRIESLHTVVGN